MLPDDLLEDVAHLFSLLSDPTRLRLVRELHAAGELPVGELAERAGTSLANASQHLARLTQARLVLRRRDGKRVLCRVEDPRIEQLCEIMCSRVQAAPAARTVG